MRVRASVVGRAATALAFGATAVLAVSLSQGGSINAALASDKGADGAAPAARCPAVGLRVSVAASAAQATAVTRYLLEFTNVSAAPCTLAGYPQVAAYRGDGVQIGQSASPPPSLSAGNMSGRGRTSPAARVLLAPGQSAHAVLDAAAPVADCRPVSASGLRVVAPGQTAARYLRHPWTVCSARAAHQASYLLVHAVQAGPGSPAGQRAASPAGTAAD